MKIGIVFPQNEFGNDPGALKAYTQAVEDLGFSHILAYEHVLGMEPTPENYRLNGWEDRWRGPYTHEHPFHEPFVLFGFMAAITSRLEFATGIIVLPQRKAQLVAKQAAELDLLSNGRLRLGIGVGWNKAEILSMGEDPALRGRLVDEQLDLMQALWTQELVQFEGKWHKLTSAGISPMPVQRPIPLWFGGHADAVMRRVARYGGGWMPGFRQAGQAQAWLEKLDRALAAEGKTRQDIGIEPRLVFKEGNPDIWQKTLSGWQAAGAGHASLNTMGCGFETPGQHLDALKTFAEGMGL